MMADYPVPLLEPQIPQMVIYRLVKAHGPINRVMMYPFALNFIALVRKIEQIIKIHITELYIIIAYPYSRCQTYSSPQVSPSLKILLITTKLSPAHKLSINR
jgi:hypothetical protein